MFLFFLKPSKQRTKHKTQYKKNDFFFHFEVLKFHFVSCYFLLFAKMIAIESFVLSCTVIRYSIMHKVKYIIKKETIHQTDEIRFFILTGK